MFGSKTSACKKCQRCHQSKIWRWNHVCLADKKAERKADSTLRSSQAVPHPSTDRALRCLTSEVKRDPVHSTRYGRRRKLKICKYLHQDTHSFVDRQPFSMYVKCRFSPLSSSAATSSLLFSYIDLHLQVELAFSCMLSFTQNRIVDKLLILNSAERYAKYFFK